MTGPVVKNSSPVTAYTTDNCDSSVKVIDLVTQEITDTINTGGCFRADELSFDPVDQVFLVANPSEQNIGKTSSVPFRHLDLDPARFTRLASQDFGKDQFRRDQWHSQLRGSWYRSSQCGLQRPDYSMFGRANEWSISDAVAVVDARGRAAHIQGCQHIPNTKLRPNWRAPGRDTPCSSVAARSGADHGH